MNSSPTPPSEVQHKRYATFVDKNKTTVVLGLILFVLIFLLVWRFWDMASHGIPLNSDWAVGALEAQAILHGNLLLHGWWLPTDNDTLTDTPFWILSILLRGVSPSALYLAPSLIFTLVVSFALFLSGHGHGLRDGLIAPAITFVCLAAEALVRYPTRLNSVLLVGEIHIGTLLYFLIAVSLAMRAIRPTDLYWVGANGFLAAAVFSDPSSLLLGVGGFLAGVVMERRNLWTWGIGPVVAVGVAFAARHVVASMGGFTSIPYPIVLSSWSDFFVNIHLVVEGWFYAFGGDFLGQQVGIALVPVLARAVIAGVSMFGLASWTYEAIRGKSSGFAFNMLGAGSVLLLAGILATSTLSEQGLWAARFLALPAVCGSVLAARRLVPFVKRNRLTMVVAVVVVVPLLLVGIRWKPPVMPQAILASWLETHHLTHGYGGYWASTLTTVEADGQVTVRQVAGPGNRLYAYQRLGSAVWYAHPLGGPAFLVVQDPPYPGVTVGAATKAWGAPSQVDHVGGYTVLVWQHDIWAPIGP